MKSLPDGFTLPTGTKIGPAVTSEEMMAAADLGITVIDYRKRAALVTAVKAKWKADKPALVAPSFDPSGPVWEIPLVTKSEINLRDWRKRSKRSDEAWRAVSRAVGPKLAALTPFAAMFHLGKPIRIILTRLGGRAVDKSNLPTTVKACEDALAHIIGADDGSALWQAEWHQEPGGPCGVRIRLEFPK